MGKDKEQQSYEILRRFRVRENGHAVHYYEVEFEDGTRDTVQGYFANAIRDEDEPGIQCGNKTWELLVVSLVEYPEMEKHQM